MLKRVGVRKEISFGGPSGHDSHLGNVWTNALLDEENGSGEQLERWNGG